MAKDGRSGSGDRGGGPLPPSGPAGATGFYYITPGSEWDYTLPHARRRFGALFILPGYILRELVRGVVLATAVFSLILMAIFASQVMRDGVGAYTMLKVSPNFLPLICPFVLPLAIITGIVLCYSRLAKDNEIMAAYAGGVGPVWMVMPTLLVSVLAIFVTLTLNEVALMPAIRNIERLVLEDQANILMRMVTRPGNITVPADGEYMAMSKLDADRDPSGRASLDITRFAHPDDGTDGLWDRRFPYPTKRLLARDHKVRDFSSDGSNQLVLKMSIFKPVFQDLHETEIDKSFVADSESGEERVMLNNRQRVSIHSNRSSFWPILRLAETRREAMERRAEIAAGLGELPEERRREAESRYNRLERVIRDRTSEINMRLALAFSCLSFAVMGIPLGMRARGSMAMSFAIGIGVSTVFFLLLKSAEMQVSQGLLPFWVIWIPNALVFMLGLLLWRRNAVVR